MADDVDDVILTHVHSDHTGWNTRPSSSGWVPRFSNARYHLHDADVAWMRGFEDEEDVREFAEAIAPLESAGQLDASIEDRELSPGLSLRHAPGHTPGHRCVLLDTGGERVLFAGDLLHFTFQPRLAVGTPSTSPVAHGDTELGSPCVIATQGSPRASSRSVVPRSS
jgi:glyoxylase-like metal-dependent hydrolase (beta-lactamase superfamily II)